MQTPSQDGGGDLSEPIPAVSGSAPASEVHRAEPAVGNADGKQSLAEAPLVVEYWSIERLREYERNPRKNDAVVDRMVTLIREFGFRIPVVARADGQVVDGHLRLKAARKIGLKQLPVALADNLTDAQIRAFRLAANKSVSWAKWDTELLRVELGDLKFENFDLSLTGFSGVEIEQFFAPETSPETEWNGMPEFDQQNRLAFRSITVHLKDELAVIAFAKAMGQPITEKTKFVWYPQEPEEHYIDKRYTADDPAAVPDLHSLKGAFR